MLTPGPISTPATSEPWTKTHDTEAKRPEFKRQAQEGVVQDPNLDLFDFVDHRLKQKDADLITGIAPSIYVFCLLANPS